ncbi:MAG: phosphopantetheine-binding protein [bacterium]
MDFPDFNDREKNSKESSILFFSTPIFQELLKRHQMNMPVNLFIINYLMFKYNLKETEITYDADLFKDLGLDSLDFIELSTCIQTFFGPKVSLYDARDNGEIDCIIGEIVEYCEANKSPEHVWTQSSLIMHSAKQKKIKSEFTDKQFY